MTSATFARLLIPAAVLAVFWPTLSADLVYDDWVNFDRNQPLRDGDWLAMIVEPYFGPDTTYWRPITSLAMLVAHQTGGMPAVHFVGIAAHLAATLCVCAIARQLHLNANLARLAGLLFALHPVVVESVAWASALPSVLSGLFVLLATRSALLWSQGNTAYASWCAAVWLLLAMLSKESGVVGIPLIAIAAFGSSTRSRSEQVSFSCSALLLGVSWLATHIAMVGYRQVLGDDTNWLCGMAQMAVRELTLLIAPWPLTPFRAPPTSTGSTALDAGLVFTLVASVVAIAIHWRRLAVRWRSAIGLLAMPLLLAALTFDAVGPHPLTDRYLYVSVSGFALLLALALQRRAALLIGLVGGYGFVAAAQVHVWQDHRTFVTHVKQWGEHDPSVRVLVGELALQQGDPAGLRQARVEYRRALELWPDRHDEFARLQRAAAIAGLAWCDFKDPNSCSRVLGPSLIKRFRRALAVDDEYVPAWVGLGVACGINGRNQEARMALRSALTLDPMCPQAWFNLGRVQNALGQRDEARESLRSALRCDPSLAAAEELLGRL